MTSDSSGQQDTQEAIEVEAEQAQNSEESLAMQIEQPMATHRGVLKLGDVEIDCYVLEDGRRLLSGRAVTKGMGLSGRGPGISRFAESKSLRPYLSEAALEALENPIEFDIGTGAVPPLGYEATILPELCNAVIEANDQGALKANQAHMVEAAHILMRGFSVVGIVALVDEATGYQDYRSRQALEKILEKFLRDELAAWAKRFPDEFYQQIFRLRGWDYDPHSVKRPILVGKLTNDVVYERLAPGVLEELKERTPIDDKGRRKHHYHRWLTENVGHPKLQEHLAAVIALMKASPNWSGFMRLLNRALPKYSTQMTLPMFDEDDGLPL